MRVGRIISRLWIQFWVALQLTDIWALNVDEVQKLSSDRSTIFANIPESNFLERLGLDWRICFVETRTDPSNKLLLADTPRVEA
jgi:hypothetical protein